MHFIRPSPGSRFNLPRGGGVAYAAQESWVQNETIKVIFFPLFNKIYILTVPGKYPLWGPLRRNTVSERCLYAALVTCTFSNFSRLVLYQCALTRDLELFEAGDATEVGEKGLTLRQAHTFYHVNLPLIEVSHSGGQKVMLVG